MPEPSSTSETDDVTEPKEPTEAPTAAPVTEVDGATEAAPAPEHVPTSDPEPATGLAAKAKQAVLGVAKRKKKRSSVLASDDVIEDRELRDADGDELAHRDIAHQLADLAKTVDPPVNIALYGPWGSGKSGIGNLLQKEIASWDGRLGGEYVRLDAFKHSDLPLRRSFVHVIAMALGQDDKAKYGKDLYAGTTKTELTLGRKDWLRLAGVFAGFLAIIVFGLAMVLALVAWRQDGSWWDHFTDLVKTTATASLLPATLVTGLVALGSKSFQVDRSTARPESAEQYEQLFTDLIKDSGKKRVVIFVDELDRCAPHEVVGTLDTIRTFLGVKGCIFVVAADQQVLEAALTEGLRQTTPADEANPYYSTGSAYLDKVFQYQVSMPPLLTQSVGAYARTLVEGRAGIWTDLNTRYVLDVLIPSHVRSPRRVKHLINAFALTYRLIEQRHKQGLLSTSPRDVAPAIAKLVCLRVEFPAFARHLELDPHLPEWVLAVREGAEDSIPERVEPRVKALAKEYATSRPPADVIADEPAETVLSQNEDNNEDTVTGHATPVERAHAAQLFAYLTRTRPVTLSRDLVYAQSTGTANGLDGALALKLEEAASDNDTEAVTEILRTMEADDQYRAFAFLVALMRDSSALLGPNIVHATLTAIDDLPDAPHAPFVENLLEAMNTFASTASGMYGPVTARVAWDLTKETTEAHGGLVRHAILQLAESGNLRAKDDFIFEDAQLAIATERSHGDVVALNQWLADGLMEPDTALEPFFAQTDDALIDCLQTLRPNVEVWVDSQLDEVNTYNSKAEVHRAAKERGEEPEPLGAEPTGPDDVLALLGSLAQGREAPVQHAVLRLLLELDAPAAVKAAEDIIPHTAPIHSPALVTLALRAAAQRPLESRSEWFAHINTSGITEVHDGDLYDLALKTWTDSTSDLSDKESALETLAPLTGSRLVSHCQKLTDYVLEHTVWLVDGDDQCTTLVETLDAATKFTRHGYVDVTQFQDGLLEGIADILAEPFTTLSDDGPMHRYATVTIPEVLEGRKDVTSREEHNRILQAALSSPWLSDIQRLETASGYAQIVGPDDVAFPNTTEVLALIEAHGKGTHAALQRWLPLVKPTPTEFAAIYDAAMAKGLSPALLVPAAEEVTSTWDGPEHEAMLSGRFGAVTSLIPSTNWQAVLGWGTIEDARAANLLVERYKTVTNATGRDSVVSLARNHAFTDTSSRGELYEQIVIPMLSEKVGSKANIASVNSGLDLHAALGNAFPHGYKRTFQDALRAAAVSANSKDLDRRAKELGITLPSRGLFGLKK